MKKILVFIILSILLIGVVYGGDCSGSPTSCASQGSGTCSTCGCSWDSSGPCVGSCSCGGESQQTCVFCRCYWSMGCIGSCSCSPLNSAECSRCRSCSWDPAGPCSGTPTVCVNHATQTPCESCGCTWTEDTCTYGGSGDWDVNCADNCTIITNTNLPANTLNLYGTGTFTILANITTDKVIKENTCQMINKINDGNRLIIKLG